MCIMSNLTLQQVVDHVLKEPGQTDQVLYNRAKVRQSIVVDSCGVPFSNKLVGSLRTGPAPRRCHIQICSPRRVG